MINRHSFLLLTFFLVCTAATFPLSQVDAQSTSNGTSPRPNIVLIMADDMGYSDIGRYGSEIETPNLDRMATGGKQFTAFYNMAKCQSTRASLITGLYGRQPHAGNAQSIGSLLGNAGYYTAMVGKEHFTKWVPADSYAQESFDDSLFFPVITPYFVPPDGNFRHPFVLNGERIHPDDMDLTRRPFHKTDALTDYAVRFLEQHENNEAPFFLYLPYHAPHYPLQARQETIEKYRETYREGWDQLRKERFERKKEIGLFPSSAKLPDPEDNVYPHNGSEQWYRYHPWDSLNEDQKKARAEEMAIYAAMVDQLDRNIGRVMKQVEKMGESKNTLFLFLSDNGACPYDNGRREKFKNTEDAPAGSGDTYLYMRPEWAALSNTPYRFFKQYGHDGGSHAPMLAYWPGTIEPEITQQPGHVVDILPTLLDLVGKNYPDQVKGKATPSPDGKSLLPVFKGKKRKQPEIIVSGWGSDKRMVRMQDWQIVRRKNKPWELYNLSEDPTARNNLASKKPEKVNQLSERFREWLEKNEIKLP